MISRFVFELEILVPKCVLEATEINSPVQLPTQINQVQKRKFTRKPAKPGSPETKLVTTFAINAANVRSERFSKIVERNLRDCK